MTFQEQNINSIIDYFWSAAPPTARAAEIRQKAIQYLYSLGWFSRNFSRQAYANAQSLQRQYRTALLG